MSNQPPNTRLMLLSNATANGTGEWKEWTGVGSGTIHAYGTFDTSTITIQISTDGGATATALSTTYTAAAAGPFLHGNVLVRAVLSSVGASTSVSCDLIPGERP